METVSAPTSAQLPDRLGVMIDFALAGGMFLLFFAVILPPHIPVYDPAWKSVLSAYTATVMAGFFWLFFSLFRVTLTDQLRGKNLDESKFAVLAKLLRYA